MSTEPAQGVAQKNYKLVIQSIKLIFHTKQLIRTALKAQMELNHVQNMQHHYSRVRMKQLPIPANQTSIILDNVLTGALPDLVIVRLVFDANLANNYQRNLLNFQNFGVNCSEEKRNGTSVPLGSFTQNFANEQYLRIYMTLLYKLECGTGEKVLVLPRPSGPTNTRYTRSKLP